jgi:hypothetical protein
VSESMEGPGWWLASDGRWYAPELHPDQSAPTLATTPIAQPVPATPTPLDGEGMHSRRHSKRSRSTLWLGLGALAIIGGGIGVFFATQGSPKPATALTPSQSAFLAGLYAGKGFYSYNNGSDLGCEALAGSWPGARSASLTYEYLNGCVTGWKIQAKLATIPTTTEPPTKNPPGLVDAILGDPAVGLPRNEISVRTKVDPNDPTWAGFYLAGASGYQNSVQGATGIAHLVDGTWKVVAGPGTNLLGCPTPGDTSNDLVPAAVLAALGFSPCPSSTVPASPEPSSTTTSTSLPLMSTTPAGIVSAVMSEIALAAQTDGASPPPPATDFQITGSYDPNDQSWVSYEVSSDWGPAQPYVGVGVAHLVNGTWVDVNGPTNEPCEPGEWNEVPGQVLSTFGIGDC